jgi:hypothetical protein
MKIHQNGTAMAAVMAALTIAGQARADTINFFLNQPECTGSCTTAPALISNSSAVEVIVTTTTGTTGDFTGATVQFIAPGPSTNLLDDPALINVNGSSSATVSIPGGVVGPGNEDHFGTFSDETGAVDAHTLTFTLIATNGNSWTDAADVLTPTTNFAAAYGHGFEAVTAAQDAGFFTATPLPATLPLFAGGLGLVGYLTRRRKLNGTQALSAA